MTEYPPSNRSKQRYLVEWQKDDSLCTGMTQDISPTGMFVRSTNIPALGHTVSLKLQLPEGQKLRVRGTVVRSYLAPENLRQFLPSGYGIRLNEAPEAYFQLLAHLFGLRFSRKASKLAS